MSKQDERTGLFRKEHFGLKDSIDTMRESGMLPDLEQHLVWFLGQEVMKKVDDGRAYVVRRMGAVEHEIVKSGLVRLHCEVLVVLARAADAEVGEMVWQKALDPSDGSRQAHARRLLGAGPEWEWMAFELEKIATLVTGENVQAWKRVE